MHYPKDKSFYNLLEKQLWRLNHNWWEFWLFLSDTEIPLNTSCDIKFSNYKMVGVHHVFDDIIRQDNLPKYILCINNWAW